MPGTQALREELSTSRQTNIGSLEINSPPLSSSTGTARFPKLKRSRSSQGLSKTAPLSRTPKRIKPSNSTSRNWTQSAERVAPTSLPNSIVNDRTMIANSTLIRSRSPLSPSTDHSVRNQRNGMNPQVRNGNSPQLILDGQNQMKTCPMDPFLSVVSVPSKNLTSTVKISPAANTSSDPLGMPLPGFPPLNGNASLEEKSLTSTTSSHLSTALQLMKRGRLALETQKSVLESLMRNVALAQPTNGFQRGTSPLVHLPSLSPTVLTNCVPMETTLTANSLPRCLNPTPELSYSTSPSATSFKEDKPSSSLTTNVSLPYTRPSSCPTESKSPPKKVFPINQLLPMHPEARRISVNRFNSSNGCPSTQSDCRYHHICKLCKKPGHGKEQCPK